MMQFFSEQFSWPHIPGQLMWALLLTLGGFIWGWVRRGPLMGRARAIGLWVTSFFLVFLVVAFLTSLRRGPDAHARKPDLRGQIDLVGIGQAPIPPRSTMLTLVVSIRNLGAPSIVDQWALSVVPAGGSMSPAEVFPLPEGPIALERRGSPPTTFEGKDVLYRKVETVPIPQNSKARGLLAFVVNVPSDAVFQPGTKYRLSFQDVYGTTYSTEYVIAGKALPEGRFIFPGLSAPQNK
jgi:hypothetical protein